MIIELLAIFELHKKIFIFIKLETHIRHKIIWKVITIIQLRMKFNKSLVNLVVIY